MFLLHANSCDTPTNLFVVVGVSLLLLLSSNNKCILCNTMFQLCCIVYHSAAGGAGQLKNPKVRVEFQATEGSAQGINEQD